MRRLGLDHHNAWRCRRGCAAEKSTQLSGNLVENPSFEVPASGSPLPANWHGESSVYTRDASTAHRGKAALRFTNQDAKRYVLCSQKVPLQPGRKYAFSAWVKTKDVVGNGSGATICVECQDATGKWLGGAYPAGVKDTNDWTKIAAVVQIPEQAASAKLSCYVRRGMTGTAWFDDVELVRIVHAPMQSMVLSPLYRGRITADGPQEVRVRLRFNLVDHDLKPSDVTVSYRVCDPTGKELAAKSGIRVDGEQPSEAPPPRERVHDVVIPARDWPVGKYRLEISLTGPGGNTLQVVRHELVRLSDDFRPKVTIDWHRRLLVDGKPFFPIGMYWHVINAEDMAVYAQSKFNCLMPYSSPNREQMDLAQKHGLKVIYSVKDLYAGMHGAASRIKHEADEEPQVRQRFRTFRDHPALLAWYLNDELPQSYMPRLEAHERWAREDDPQHPTWVVLYQFKEVRDYCRTFDVIGTDPYPIGRSPASMAAQWTAETFRQVEYARPMWQVPQVHNWANYAKGDAQRKKAGRTPTFDEVRSMAWQCIAEGATGLVFYSWFDVKRNPDVSFDVQWDGLKRIAAEIDRMAPMILSIEECPKVVARGSESPDPPSWLHLLRRRYDGKIYLVAVNDGDGEGRITLQLPVPCKQVEVLGENRSLRPEGAEFQDELAKLAVHVYEVTTR